MEKRAISFLPPMYAVIPFAPRGNRLAFHAPEHEKNSAGGRRGARFEIGNFRSVITEKKRMEKLISV